MHRWIREYLTHPEELLVVMEQLFAPLSLRRNEYDLRLNPAYLLEHRLCNQFRLINC